MKDKYFMHLKKQEDTLEGRKAPGLEQYYQVVERVIFRRLLENAQIQGIRNL